MEITPDTIQVIIQGGAVGLMLVFGFGAYRLVKQMMTLSADLIQNHLHELTEEIRGLRNVFERFLVTQPRKRAKKGDE